MIDQDVNEQQVRLIEQYLSKKCKKCMTIKAPKSHHCSICRRCVARMDHHCPWVNNCVGFYNQKHFLLFLIYVFLGSSHALFVIGMKAGFCLNDHRHQCPLFSDIQPVVIAGASMFMALLFDLFVIVMFCDQMSCILDSTSTIDKLQKKRAKTQNNEKKEDPSMQHKPRTAWQNICCVFTGDPNGSFSWRWFYPIDIQNEMNLEKEFS